MITLGKILQNRRLVLGRNERYLKYIRPYNRKKAIRIADNKVLSKLILAKNNIPVPKKIKLISNRSQLNSFNFDLLPKSFVIKPVRGVRGGGVEIFYNRDKQGRWIRADRSRMNINDLKSYMQDILDGKYSLFNQPDKVLIEERVRPHKNFKPYIYKGTPDIRIIVSNKIPIMSYVRLPTKESNGKANLDLGAIGAGIDIAVGKTTDAIIGKSTSIEYVPGTRLPLSGIRIPYWNKILKYAVEASKVTGLGFAAIDFLIDQDLGPLIVELNARPGLSIQLANQDGLRWRLRKAKGLKVKTVEQGVRLGKDLFGGEIEEEIETISGKQVIGLSSEVKVSGKDAEQKEIILAKVDTGADRTSIDEETMRDLGYSEAIDYFNSFNYPLFRTMEEAEAANEERKELLKNKEIFNHSDIKSRVIVKSSSGYSMRPIFPIKLEISGTAIETDVTVIKRSSLTYKMIIGKKDLKQFLIDPSKK
jgi:alpha-L-glutamate ligase-like protein